MTPERPRDRLGRPLPPDADPTLIAEAIVDITDATDAVAWAIAMGYLDRGLPFHTHEVFEQRWRTCAADDRAAWRAMAQWGAALTHAARGNAEGAQRLAKRALQTLDAAPTTPTGIDEFRMRASCARLEGIGT